MIPKIANLVFEKIHYSKERIEARMMRRIAG